MPANSDTPGDILPGTRSSLTSGSDLPGTTSNYRAINDESAAIAITSHPKPNGTLARAYLEHRIIHIPTNLAYITLSAISEFGFAFYFKYNVIQAYAWWARFIGLAIGNEWSLDELMENPTVTTLADISVFGEAAAATLITLDAEESIVSVLNMLENIFRRLCGCTSAEEAEELLANATESINASPNPRTTKQAMLMALALVAVYWCTGIITAGTYSGIKRAGHAWLAIVCATGQALLHIATTKDNPAKYALSLLEDIKEYLRDQDSASILGFTLLHSGAALSRSTMVILTALGLAAKGSLTSTALGIISLPTAIFMNIITATRTLMTKQTLRNQRQFIRYCKTSIWQTMSDCVTGTQRDDNGQVVTSGSWATRLSKTIEIGATSLFSFNREAMLILLLLSILDPNALHDDTPTDEEISYSGYTAIALWVPTMVFLCYFADFFDGGARALVDFLGCRTQHNASATAMLPPSDSISPVSPTSQRPGGSSGATNSV